MFKSKINYAFQLILFTLPQLLFPILNGYPIVYSDTSTYISTGFNFEMPFDRPLAYGIFLYITSLAGFSFWITVVVQALINSIVVLKFIELFGGKGLGNILLFISWTIISIFGGISWYTGQLMPDFFTALSVLCLLILLHPKLDKVSTFLYGFLYLLSLSTHFSHVSLNFALLVLIIFLYLFFRKRWDASFGLKIDRIWIGLGLILTAWITMLSPMAKFSHVYLVGSLAGNGMLTTILQNECFEKNYALCEYKDSIPSRAWEFIWDEDSPLQKIGGWKNSKDELKDIIHISLSKSKYLKLHLKNAIISSGIQMISFRLGDGNGPFTEETRLFQRIRDYSREEKAFLVSRQQQNTLYDLSDWLNPVHYIFIALMVCLLFFLTIRRKSAFWNIVLIVVAAILLNTVITATLSTPADRYMGRMIWLIPFMILAFISRKN